METEELTRLVDEIYKVSVQSCIDLERSLLSPLCSRRWFLLSATRNRNQSQRNGKVSVALSIKLIDRHKIEQRINYII